MAGSARVEGEAPGEMEAGLEISHSAKFELSYLPRPISLKGGDLMKLHRVIFIKWESVASPNVFLDQSNRRWEELLDDVFFISVSSVIIPVPSGGGVNRTRKRFTLSVPAASSRCNQLILPFCRIDFR